MTKSALQTTPCVKNIRIYYECEGGIEKSVPRITDWHHVTCIFSPVYIYLNVYAFFYKLFIPLKAVII